MFNYRGYVMDEQPGDFDEEGNPSFSREAREALAKDLASKWSAAHHKLEQRSYRCGEEQQAYWDHIEHLVDCARDERIKELGRELTACEEENLYEEITERAYENSRDGQLRKELELIEAQLDIVGARMMRPYEHHGEDERYMEYMETRYDSYSYDEYDY